MAFSLKNMESLALPSFDFVHFIHAGTMYQNKGRKDGKNGHMIIDYYPLKKDYADTIVQKQVEKNGFPAFPAFPPLSFVLRGTTYQYEKFKKDEKNGHMIFDYCPLKKFSDNRENPKRIVRSHKEKKYEELTMIIKQVRNQKKIKDMSSLLTSFEELTRAYTKAFDAVILKEDNGIAPRFFVDCLVELEDFINDVWDDRVGRKNLSKNNFKSLASLRQKFKKYVKDFECDLAKVRENPDQKENQKKDEDMDSNEGESKDVVPAASFKKTEKKIPKAAKIGGDSNSDDSFGWGSDFESSLSSKEDEGRYQSMRERFLKKSTDRDDDEKKEKKKEHKEKPEKFKRKEEEDESNSEWQKVRGEVAIPSDLANTKIQQSAVENDAESINMQQTIKIDEIQKIVFELAEELNKSKHNEAVVKEQLAELLDDNEHIKMQLTNTNDKLQKKVFELTEELNESKHKETVVKEQSAVLLDDAESIKTQLTRKIDELQKIVFELTKELNESKHTEAVVKEQSAKLLDDNEHIKMQLTNTNDKLQKKVCELTEELNESKHNEAVVKEQVAELLDDVKSINTQLTNANDEIQKIVFELTEELNESKHKEAVVKDQSAKLLDDAESIKTQLTRKIDELQKIVFELAEELNESKHTEAVVKEQSAKLLDDNEHIKMELTNTNDELQKIVIELMEELSESKHKEAVFKEQSAAFLDDEPNKVNNGLLVEQTNLRENNALATGIKPKRRTVWCRIKKSLKQMICCA